MNTTRRLFLQSLAPIAGVLAAPNLLRAANLNGRVQHACIGVGGMMGFNDFQNFKQHARTDIVAICDVDAGNLERALKELQFKHTMPNSAYTILIRSSAASTSDFLNLTARPIL